MNFWESSHRSRWLFTPERLLEVRRANRERSIATIRQLRTPQAANEAPTTTEAATNGTARDNKVKAITLEQEGKLGRYYQSKIQEVCKALHLPNKVAAAAVLFFQRFYLAFSVLDHDPKTVMLTCIYLASKAEESYISARDLCARVHQEPATVLGQEVALLQGLRYDLVTHLPHRALAGLLADIESLRRAGGEEAARWLEPGLRDAPSDSLELARRAAQAALDVLLLTDAPLLFPPGQLALAALRSGLRKAGLRLGAYLQRVAARTQSGDCPHGANGRGAELEEALTRLDELAVASQQPDEKDVRRISKRLKECHNPLLDPTSEVHQQAAAAAEQEAEQRRQKKVNERQAAHHRELQALGMSATTSTGHQAGSQMEHVRQAASPPPSPQHAG